MVVLDSLTILRLNVLKSKNLQYTFAIFFFRKFPFGSLYDVLKTQKSHIYRIVICIVLYKRIKNLKWSVLSNRLKGEMYLNNTKSRV